MKYHEEKQRKNKRIRTNCLSFKECKNSSKIVLSKKKKKKKNRGKLQRTTAQLLQNLSNDEKDKKREHGKNRYRNASQEEKQKLKKYGKNCRETKKMTS